MGDLIMYLINKKIIVEKDYTSVTETTEVQNNQNDKIIVITVALYPTTLEKSDLFTSQEIYYFVCPVAILAINVKLCQNKPNI